jgi:hypothetical protein
MQQSVNTLLNSKEAVFSAWSLLVIKKSSEAVSGSIEWSVEFRGTNPPEYEFGGKGIELSWQFQNNG